MSARDEIARALHRADVEPRRFDPHWNVHEWDEISEESRDYWYRLADAAQRVMEGGQWLTKDGHPGHPLYLKGDLTPRRWT